MNYLFPIYNNNIGSVYALKSSIDESLQFEKIQLQLAEVAIIFSKEGLKNLLKVVSASKKGYKCSDCCQESHLKVIKCETEYAKVVLKINKKNIVTFEELIKGALFKLEMEFILNTNDIR